MQRLTSKQAAAELSVSIAVLYWMCRNNALPPGYAAVIKEGKYNTYYIYKGINDEGEKLGGDAFIGRDRRVDHGDHLCNMPSHV